MPVAGLVSLIRFFFSLVTSHHCQTETSDFYSLFNQEKQGDDSIFLYHDSGPTALSVFCFCKASLLTAFAPSNSEYKTQFF